MKVEFLTLGLLPAILAVVALSWSMVLSIRSRSVLQGVVSLMIALLVGWSLLVLYSIFVQGAWPSFVAHVCIAVALFLTILQSVVVRFSVGSPSTHGEKSQNHAMNDE